MFILLDGIVMVNVADRLTSDLDLLRDLFQQVVYFINMSLLCIKNHQETDTCNRLRLPTLTDCLALEVASCDLGGSEHVRWKVKLQANGVNDC